MHISKRTGVLLLSITTVIVVALGLVLLLPKHKSAQASTPTSQSGSKIKVAPPITFEPSKDTSSVPIGAKVLLAPQPVSDYTQFESNVIFEINIQRSIVNLPPLTLDNRLTHCAYQRTHEMYAGDWYGHTDPATGKSASDEACPAFVPGLSGFGETLDGVSPDQVVNDWMSSPEHRDVLLSPIPTHIGFAYSSNGSSNFQIRDSDNGSTYGIPGMDCAIFAAE